MDRSRRRRVQAAAERDGQPLPLHRAHGLPRAPPEPRGLQANAARRGRAAERRPAPPAAPAASAVGRPVLEGEVVLRAELVRARQDAHPAAAHDPPVGRIRERLRHAQHEPALRVHPLRHVRALDEDLVRLDPGRFAERPSTADGGGTSVSTSTTCPSPEKQSRPPLGRSSRYVRRSAGYHAEGRRRRGRTGAARHHIRRGLVMVEVALAVMLVMSAGLLIRTVYNLSVVDSGFDQSRLVTFQMSLATPDYPQAAARAQLYQRLLDELRGLPGVQGASAMSGLPPDRPVNANTTDIGNYVAPPEGPAELVDYYQYRDDRLLRDDGHSDRPGSRVPRQRHGVGPGGDRERGYGQRVLEGVNPIGQTLKPGFTNSARVPDFTVISVAKDVKQGSIDPKTRPRSIRWWIRPGS